MRCMVRRVVTTSFSQRPRAIGARPPPAPGFWQPDLELTLK
jgi:hypothetical protein